MNSNQTINNEGTQQAKDKKPVCMQSLVLCESNALLSKDLDAVCVAWGLPLKHSNFQASTGGPSNRCRFTSWLSCQDPEPPYSTSPGCSYLLVEERCRHPVQHPNKAQPSTSCSKFLDSSALPAHTSLYTLTCLVRAVTSYPAQM